ncbi:MAG: MFS transporter [Myxococcota bacterium]|nr:MFS transporter [Myxococcota bacterium]
MSDRVGSGRLKIGLFLLLSVAVVFEGFDTKLASLVLPMLGGEFGAGPETLFSMLSILNSGMVLGVLIIPLADRFGRRPIFLLSFSGYALFTLLTAFVTSVGLFALVQFFSKMFLVSQLALAYVILSEEFPAESRGRANGLMGAFASVGAALPAFFLAPLEATSFGWRGLFVLGSLPLLLLPLYWARLRETRLFERVRAQRRESFFEMGRRLMAPGLRVRFVGVTLVWFIVNFWASVAMFSFVYYVFNERDWTAGDLQWVPLATVPFAFFGYALAGVVMDFVGRKQALCGFLILGVAASVLCYQTESYWGIVASWAALQMLQGIWTIAATMTTELFVTEVRASANALAHNLLGRWGMVLGPLAVGFLSGPCGSTGNAVSILAGVNLLFLPAVIWMLPETRGIELGSPMEGDPEREAVSPESG